MVKPFLAHLEDLRRTLIRSAAALAAGMLVAIPLAPRVLQVLRRPLEKAGRDPERFLRTLEVAGGFAVALNVIFWTGLLLSAPLIVFFLGGFVFPGLTRRERRVVRRAAGFAVALFAAGVLLGYTCTLDVALRVMFRINEWMGITVEFVRVTDYVGFVLKLLLAFGLAFELPVLILALGQAGLLRAEQLRNKRRHAIVLLLVLAMVLTPPDVFTQLLMAVPLILLYEMCVWLLWLKERRAARPTGA